MKRDTPSLQTLADVLGVSRATVSRALRNSPLVNAELRKKIHRTAKKIGYRFDPKLTELMSYLRRGRSQGDAETMALVFSRGYEEFRRMGAAVLPMTGGLRRRATELGFRLETFHLADYNYQAESLSRVLWNRGIRGVVVGSLRPEEANFQLDWGRFSAVSTSFSLEKPYLHRICHFHFHSLRQTYERLLKLGYRRIGMALDSKADRVSDHNWTAGYLFEKYRHTSQKRIEPFVNYDGVEEQKLRKWIDTSKPEAIIVPGNGTPYLLALQNLGYDVPRDIGVAALGVRREHKEMSGIDQRSEQLGRVAASVLASLIVQNEVGIPNVPVTHQVEGVWCPGKTLRRLRR